MCLEHVRPPLDRHRPPALCALLRECWSRHPDERPPFRLIVPRLRAMREEAMAHASRSLQGSSLGVSALGVSGGYRKLMRGSLRGGGSTPKSALGCRRLRAAFRLAQLLDALHRSFGFPVPRAKAGAGADRSPRSVGLGAGSG